jgi:hypothetical protein
VADVERPEAESGLTLLWLSMAGVALVVLLDCSGSPPCSHWVRLRRLISAPITWLLTCLAGGGMTRASRR